MGQLSCGKQRMICFSFLLLVLSAQSLQVTNICCRTENLNGETAVQTYFLPLNVEEELPSNVKKSVDINKMKTRNITVSLMVGGTQIIVQR